MALGPLSPAVDRQFFDDAGNVLSGGLIYVYLAGTSTPTDTYTTSALTTPNANPVVCDSAGRATMFLDPDITYKFDVQDSGGVSLYTLDNVPGVIPVQTPITVTEDGIGSTSTDGLVLVNTTAAANNAQQWSPRERWTGRGWNATGSASRVVDAIAELVPVQQASGDPVAALILSTQVNGGGYVPRLGIQSDGIVVGAGTGILSFGSSGVSSPDLELKRIGTGLLAVDDLTGGSHGVVLRVTSDNQLDVRNRANSAGGILTAVRMDVGASPPTTGIVNIPNNNYLTSKTTGGTAKQLIGLSTTDEVAIDTDALGVVIYNGLKFASTAGILRWGAESMIENIDNGTLRLTQTSGTVGIALRFQTDGLLEVRTRADGGYANLTADNITADQDVEAGGIFIAGGTSGVATFGPAAPASITVKGGLVVAIS